MLWLLLYTSFTVNNAVRKWNVRPSTCRMTQSVGDCPEETLLYSNIVTAACAAISLRVGQVLQKYPLSWRICIKNVGEWSKRPHVSSSHVNASQQTIRVRPKSSSDKSTMYCTVAIWTKLTNNKCIGDDTKAAARRSLNCIKNKNKIKYGIKQFSIWRIKFLHPAMWHVALGWHAIEFAQTSAILEFYFWFRFRPHHRSRHVILHQSPKFYPNRTTLGRKKITSSRFSRWQISVILDFRDPMVGSLKIPIT